MSISRTPIVDINMKSSGEVGFLDQVANIRQVFGEKDVQLTNQNNAGGQSCERLVKAQNSR